MGHSGVQSSQCWQRTCSPWRMQDVQIIHIQVHIYKDSPNLGHTQIPPAFEPHNIRVLSKKISQGTCQAIISLIILSESQSWEVVNVWAKCMPKHT